MDYLVQKKLNKGYKCPSKDEGINKMRYIHIMRYCLALKMKEILAHATICMNLKDIMTNETSQSQKDKDYIIPLIRDT